MKKYIVKEDTIEQMKSMNMLFSPKIVIDNMPTITKADICTAFIQRVYELSEKDDKKLPLEFWIDKVLAEMESEG